MDECRPKLGMEKPSSSSGRKITVNDDNGTYYILYNNIRQD